MVTARAVRRLLEEPSRWSQLVDDAELILAAVEETLRYDTSVPAWRRVTRAPVTLGGVDLPTGAKLFLWLVASGRDAAVFPEPERFDLHRQHADGHLAFGGGIHYCLGATLGGTEARIALTELTPPLP